MKGWPGLARITAATDGRFRTAVARLRRRSASHPARLGHPRRLGAGAGAAGNAPCARRPPRPPPPACPARPPGRRRPAVRAQVDDPVRGLDHVQVVLDHQHRVAQRPPAAAAPPAACACPRSAGRSSARPGCRASGRSPRRCSSAASFTRCASPPDSVVAGWPEPHVAQPDVLQRLQLAARSRCTGRKNSAASSTVMSSTSVIVLPL